jgi:hypothetical protein
VLSTYPPIHGDLDHVKTLTKLPSSTPYVTADQAALEAFIDGAAVAAAGTKTQDEHESAVTAVALLSGEHGPDHGQPRPRDRWHRNRDEGDAQQEGIREATVVLKPGDASALREPTLTGRTSSKGTHRSRTSSRNLQGGAHDHGGPEEGP